MWPTRNYEEQDFYGPNGLVQKLLSHGNPFSKDLYPSGKELTDNQFISIFYDIFWVRDIHGMLYSERQTNGNEWNS